MISSQRDGDLIPNPEEAVVVRHARVRVIGDGPSKTILDGGREFNARAGLIIEPGGNGCRVEGIGITNFQKGIFINQADDLAFAGVHSYENGWEGGNSYRSDRLDLEDCEFYRNGITWTADNANRPYEHVSLTAHGFYWATGCRTLRVRRCKFWQNNGQGLYGNSSPGESGEAWDFNVEDSEFWENNVWGPPRRDLPAGAEIPDTQRKRSGAPAIQLIGMEKARITRCTFARDNGMLTCHNEGGERSLDVVVEDCTAWDLERFVTNIARGSEVTLQDCILFAPALWIATNPKDEPIIPRRVNCRETTNRQEALKWVDPVTLASLVPGVGWSPATAAPPDPIPDPLPVPDDRAAILDLLGQAEVAYAHSADALTQAQALQREEGNRLARLRELLEQ